MIRYYFDSNLYVNWAKTAQFPLDTMWHTKLDGVEVIPVDRYYGVAVDIESLRDWATKKDSKPYVIDLTWCIQKEE